MLKCNPISFEDGVLLETPLSSLRVFFIITVTSAFFIRDGNSRQVCCKADLCLCLLLEALKTMHNGGGETCDLRNLRNNYGYYKCKTNKFIRCVSALTLNLQEEGE